MACAGVDDHASEVTTRREQALEGLQREAGNPVALEVGETGDVRVLAMAPRSSVPGHTTDPAAAALAFLASHHDVFQLSATEAHQFVVTHVDVDRGGELRHVTLQRVHDGIAVFQGTITVHMDAGNGVVRALGDEAYRIAPPTNRILLDPAEALAAAGKALHVQLAPVLTEADGPHAVFTSVGTLDPIRVDATIVHVAPGDDRFAYQATVAWLDDSRTQQYQLALIDAQDGALLANHSLVHTFTGKAFHTHGPGASPTTDTRDVVSFDGDHAQSLLGWVDETRRTRGNNAVACTDLNHDNVCGAGDVQPAADASNRFDFPFDPLLSASLFKEAAVANAFWVVNDFHDRTRALGFTESARNFQTSNFGFGGAQNDEVQVDVQDGAGTNNATFATPPDGSRPRMQLFLSTAAPGPPRDSAFDSGVIYHEISHGLSNRLVGGGSTTCLRGIQSGGMGEGWGDFLGASFLDDPVIGAYVSGNAAVGIRKASMAASPFTYANIKDGTMTQVHDAGEVWAAALWTVRHAIGAAKTEQLVVAGMKLTPCNPTMLQARDAIVQADAFFNGGANRCALFSAFASRQMGFGASSPNHNSTSTIVLSTAVPPGC